MRLGRAATSVRTLESFCSGCAKKRHAPTGMPRDWLYLELADKRRFACSEACARKILDEVYAVEPQQEKLWGVIPIKWWAENGR